MSFIFAVCATLTASAAATASALSSLARLVDTDGPAIEPVLSQPLGQMVLFVSNELDVVHRGDRRFGGGIVSEANETEAATATCITIFHHNLCFVSRC